MSQSMDIYSVLLLSVGLAMDAFSVALVAGFGLGKVKLADSLKVSGTFGIAHVIMPTVGWFLGSTVLELIQRWDHWIAFTLLAIVGGKMLKEGLDKNTEDIDAKELLGMASRFTFTIAVSIDAVAVGRRFSGQERSNWVASILNESGKMAYTVLDW